MSTIQSEAYRIWVRGYMAAMMDLIGSIPPASAEVLVLLIPKARQIIEGRGVTLEVAIAAGRG